MPEDQRMPEPDRSSAPARPRSEASTRRVQLVRLVGSSLGLLVGIVFCHQFSTFQIHGFVYGAGIPVSHLPALCRWYAFLSIWLMVLPPAVLWIGSRRLLRESAQSAAVEMWTQLTILLTVVLVLGCILTWQLPYTVPVGEVF